MSNQKSSAIAHHKAGALVLPAQEKIKRLDEVASKYGGALVMADSPFESTFQLAVAMNELRELLTEEVMRPIMALMNSPLGFLTDRTGKDRYKNGQKLPTLPLYTSDEVRDCVIEAVLRGFKPVGNEMNIISSRFYAAKNGLRRRVTSYPGVIEFRDSYDVPRLVGEKGAIVKCRATWRFNGAEDSIEREFAVKGDSFATADSYSGKAERKLLNAVFQRLSGISLPDGEVTDAEIAAANATSVESPRSARPQFTGEAPAKPQKEETILEGEISGGTQPEPEKKEPDFVPTNDREKIEIALRDLDFPQERFIKGLRLIDPEKIPDTVTIVAQLSDEDCATILKDGLDEVLDYIRIKEAKEESRAGK